jgi:nitrate reductase NapE component
MAVAGVSYLTNSFTLILAPTYAMLISPILVLSFIGELSFCLWLIVKGVNVAKWNERARLAD